MRDNQYVHDATTPVPATNNPARPDEATAYMEPPANLTTRPDVRYVPGGRRATLLIRSGSGASQQVSIGSATVALGRSADCDVVLPDETVSRHHAEIRVQHGRCMLVDTGSRNRIYLNRHQVTTAAVLNDGDEIAIGPFRIGFHTTTN
jgi:pSer/pThr/pTyr-binding forkhead associated (FHA) protein